MFDAKLYPTTARLPTKRVYILNLFIVLAFLSPAGQKQEFPSHFGEDMILFTSNKEGAGIYAQLSPSGNYVVGIDRLTEDTQRQVYVWAIREQPETSPLPTYSRESEVFRHTSWHKTVSPDEKYFAARTNNQLTVLAFPELKDYKALPLDDLTEPFTYDFHWSYSSTLITTLVGEDIVVWDIASDEIYQHHLDGTYGLITPLKDGWIIEAAIWEENYSGTAFSICTLRLETCTGHSFDGLDQQVLVSPDGQTILTQRGHETASLWVWEQQQDRSYRLNDQPLISNLLYPGYLNFSPTGLYIGHDQGEIYDAATFALLQDKLPLYAPPIFLPDETHFVMLSPSRVTLYLYRLGRSEPLDSLNLAELPSLDIREYLFLERVGIQSLSPDGRLILVNLGEAAILVPIV